MKKNTKIWILAIVPLIILLGWYATEKIIIKIAVNQRCSEYSIKDDWVGCVIDLSLEKKDAKYCTSESYPLPLALFLSPYPGICMDSFAQRTESKELCNTIAKPGYRHSCLRRFE